MWLDIMREWAHSEWSGEYIVDFAFILDQPLCESQVSILDGRGHVNQISAILFQKGGQMDAVKPAVGIIIRETPNGVGRHVAAESNQILNALNNVGILNHRVFKDVLQYIGIGREGDVRPLTAEQLDHLQCREARGRHVFGAVECGGRGVPDV